MYTHTHCMMCGLTFDEETIIQDETWNTDVDDHEATLREHDWSYDKYDKVVLCPDCDDRLWRAGYDMRDYKDYLEEERKKAA